MLLPCCLFFFNDTATTEIYTLSLHDALPISGTTLTQFAQLADRAEVAYLPFFPWPPGDRKSTRLNSSHDQISYAVFCWKKKKRCQIDAFFSYARHHCTTDIIFSCGEFFIRASWCPYASCIFFLMIRRPPRPTVFPDTTLFR